MRTLSPIIDLRSAIRQARGLSIVYLATLATCHAALGPISVRGNQLLAGDAPIRLRGVAVGDPILARDGRPLSDYARIARDWHANAVRISLHPSVWKRGDHRRILDTLQREADAALDAGMYVILDWHTIGWPDKYYEIPPREWDDDPRDLYDSSFALARGFWDEVSTRFGHDGRVIFELWNEPVFAKTDDNPDVERPRWEALKPYFASLLATIRAHGNNVVLATGNDWAYDMKGIRADPLPGANIAYAWHIYAGTDDNDEKEWAAHLDGLPEAAPVLVTEWGFEEKTREHFRGSAGSFGTKFVRDFLEARGLHSTAWCWHPDWTPAMLRADWKTPTAMGRFVMDYLANPAAFGR